MTSRYLTLIALLVAVPTQANEPRDWWSLRPIERPDIPEVTGFSRTPIDAFVHAKMHEAGLSPAPPASRLTLIRRLHVDLIGLPPSPEDVDAFVNDPRPDALERWVDRLLASPAYGERWAQHWLDLARYADTHGYDKDKVRPHAWPYRDYVIRALNADRPYDRFVKEQLAGDHFYPHTRDGIVGLGFLAAGPFDYVGQIEVRPNTSEKRRVRDLDRDEMVSATMNVFASLTAQCARCHDHKFDPVSQRDYFRIQAVFAGIDRAERAYDPDPSVPRRRAELIARRAALTEQKGALHEEMNRRAGPKLAQLNHHIAEWHQRPTVSARPEYGYHSRVEPTANVEKWVQVDLGKSVPMVAIVLAGCHDTFAGIGAGFGFPPRFRVEVSDDADFREGVTMIADHTREDFPNPGTQPVVLDATGKQARYVRVTATRLAPRSKDFIFALGELLVLDADGKNRSQGRPVVAIDSIEAPPRWRQTNLTDGYYHSKKQNASALLELVAWTRDRDTLRDASTDPTLTTKFEKFHAQLATIERELASLPASGSVYAVTTDFTAQGNFTPTRGTPRSVFVLNRGDVDQPGDEVRPGSPAIVPGVPGEFVLPAQHDEAERRAALAEWIVTRENPLTWRSLVNRLWMHHFGRGIVTTPNDFGRMGAKPTHPELLDWLASEFRDGDRSLKTLHRLMVTSATYSQGGTSASAESAERYFAVMPRRRLEAEAIRDAVLVASGMLRHEMFGPGFRAFGFKDDHSPHYLYDQHTPDDPDSLKRSVYRFVVRSVPDPWMEVRDCADPSVSVGKRNETLTPLQALSQLNGDFIVTMAGHFAKRVEALGGTPRERVTIAFRLALGRQPTDEEADVLTELAEQRGLASASRVILNLNEFVFVD